jgi:hypothetical protein
VKRRFVAFVALAALALVLARPAPVAAFSGFGTMSASAQYGQNMTFRVALPGGPPERMELRLDFGDEPGTTFVAPVEASGTSASYTWDASTRYLTPNTRIKYRWRATVAGSSQVSQIGELLYADNRPGFAWHTATYGPATVHWYGAHEDEARHFGALSSGAISRAESLLGRRLTGRIDIFVYVTQGDFFGALGPGAREWTGAATYPDIRTVFMWLGGGPTDYLETAVTHELTHVVFHDATANPYHEPARWLNEGIAVWSERQNADAQQATIRSEANAGLFAFDALSGQFPIGTRGSSLAYAEGATMVDRIIRTSGRAAIARITAAYRLGATDAEALKAGTGATAETLYADYFRAFGATQPKPVQPAAIKPSIVRTPSGPAGSGPLGAPVASGNATPAGTSPDGIGTATIIGLVVFAFLVIAGVTVGLVIYRRTGQASGRTDG